MKVDQGRESEPEESSSDQDGISSHDEKSDLEIEDKQKESSNTLEVKFDVSKKLTQEFLDKMKAREAFFNSVTATNRGTIPQDILIRG